MLARLAILTVLLSMALVWPSKAHAQAYEYQDIEAIIDATWPDYAQDYAKTIAWRESGYDPYAFNPYSGATCLFQFMPETYAAYGYTYYDMLDPWTCSAAAAELYQDYGWSPWVTAY